MLALAANIELIVFDVDGVFTDGRFTLDSEGRESKSFHTQDGYGIRCLLEAGIEVGVITGRSSGAVTKRMAELGIKHVFQGVRDKRECMMELIASVSVQSTQVAAVGDDMPDLAMFEAAKLRVAVCNAVPELIAQANLLTSESGGYGAIREIAEFLLLARSRVTH